MFNFKNIFAAAVIATAGLCVADVVKPQAAEARAWCTELAGFDVCYKDAGNYGTDRIMVWKGNLEVADMNVICTGRGGNRWEGDRDTRFISYGDMEALANQWCRDY